MEALIEEERSVFLGNDVIKEIYPKSQNQLWIVYKIRNTLSYVRASHKQAIAADLKSIYKLLGEVLWERRC